MTRTAPLNYGFLRYGVSNLPNGGGVLTTTNYYDVVVIGMELGPLAAGALLAKRGFRVLIVGQGAPKDHYQCLGYTFTRRPFMLTSFESPVIRRILSELGIGQLFQHALSTPNPIYQVILDKARINVTNDIHLTGTEIRREFPRTGSISDDLFGQLGWINDEIDKLFSNDMVVPPDSFLEKREFARAEVQNPFRIGADTYFWNKLDDDSDFKQFLATPVRFETAGASPLSPLVRYRQLAGWLFDCHAIENGRDCLRDLLADQIVGQGGDRQNREQVAEIVVRKGRIQGVRLAGREELTGCNVVLTEMSPAEISNLIPPNHWTKRFRVEVNESPKALMGYTLNLGVHPEVIPAGLADTAFLSLGSGIGDELLRIEKVPQHDADKAALHVSCIVPMEDREKIVSGALRDAILDRLRWLIPFLDNYLNVIHSPFDGFGPLNLNGTADGDAPPIPHAEEIPKWLHRPPTTDGILGIENLPHRTGIKGLLLAGSQVIGGLGTEGEFWAAWGAARIAGKMDPRRERLVRSMRAKIEM